MVISILTKSPCSRHEVRRLGGVGWVEASGFRVTVGSRARGSGFGAPRPSKVACTSNYVMLSIPCLDATGLLFRNNLTEVDP